MDHPRRHRIDQPTPYACNKLAMEHRLTWLSTSKVCMACLLHGSIWTSSSFLLFLVSAESVAGAICAPGMEQAACPLVPTGTERCGGAKAIGITLAGLSRVPPLQGVTERTAPAAFLSDGSATVSDSVSIPGGVGEMDARGFFWYPIRWLCKSLKASGNTNYRTEADFGGCGFGRNRSENRSYQYSVVMSFKRMISFWYSCDFSKSCLSWVGLIKFASSTPATPLPLLLAELNTRWKGWTELI